jgi:hypothetical protein
MPTISSLHSGFHYDTITDDHLVLDENIRADVAVGTDLGAREDYNELPDS